MFSRTETPQGTRIEIIGLGSRFRRILDAAAFGLLLFRKR